ncbi:MAG: DUF86 domain-containing protein [Candidatus Bathycorpusculaceae bacterium]
MKVKLKPFSAIQAWMLLKTFIRVLLSELCKAWRALLFKVGIMSLNKDVIEARIRDINDAIRMLGDLVSRDYVQLTFYERLSIRYLIIQAVEAASSICVQILLGVFDERAEGFPECFARLSVKGVIPEDLGYRLASAARLRNLLVHRYWVIEDEKVFESVKRGLGDFKEFIEHLRRFLEGET